jgi:trk system potassium uptake protein TrkA
MKKNDNKVKVEKKANLKNSKNQIVKKQKIEKQKKVETNKQAEISKNPIKRILERAVKQKKETSSVLKKSMSQFAVIGLGRFGMKVALTLASEGNEVLAIDCNERNIHEIENYVAGTAIADSTGTNVLKQLGIKNFDCVIVCIGEDLQASILTTLICKDLGVNLVVAKANSEAHKEVLERIGADVVVFPEDYTGQKVAKMLSNPSVNEVMKLTDKFKIVEIAVPDNWQDKSIVEIDVRRKYHVSIIVIKRDEYVIYPEPETEFKKGDVLLVAGEPKRIEEVTRYSSDVIDVVHTLSNGLSLD